MGKLTRLDKKICKHIHKSGKQFNARPRGDKDYYDILISSIEKKRKRK